MMGQLIEYDCCECCDPQCQEFHGGYPGCDKPATMTLFRVDMEDEGGMRFCNGCGDDCFEAGIWTAEVDDDDAA